MTWSDNPGLAMSYFDATNLPEGQLAQQYTMDDNFFHASYGGSFLNHQFLVSAAAPVYPNAPSTLQPVLDAKGQLALDDERQDHPGRQYHAHRGTVPERPGADLRRELRRQHDLLGEPGSGGHQPQ